MRIFIKTYYMKQTSLLGLLLLVVAMAFIKPPRVITGIVTDDAGNPLITYINIKGTQKNISSAADGSFSIEVPDKKAVLIFSSAGYETKELRVGDNQRFIVRLKISDQALLDVIVTNQDRVFRKEIAGHQASVSAAKPMLGRAPGIQVGGFYDRSDRQRDGWIRNKTPYNREGYDRIPENPFLKVDHNPLSTFSIDVDAASYSNLRRIINEGRMPPLGAVRIEEMINYFSYNYPQPKDDKPFSVNTEMASCPWNPEHHLLMIGLQGKKINVESLPAANLTFLVDVSGSMNSADKLPLVKESLNLLVDQLRPADRVSLVVYAGNAGLVLPPTTGKDKQRIREAISQLEAGGSTAGGMGIQLAYRTARQNFISEGNNRVILCTDGDFNVGASSDDELERIIEEERKSGVYLTVLGFGTGNYQDAKMQKLANKGNGNHAYIDGMSEAKKVLSSEFGGTLFTIAKDVKLQIEFNPAQVQAYRLIGYENRMLAKEDFNNDKKDAGDMGSCHTVTALYELVPPGIKMKEPDSIQLSRYTSHFKASIPAHSDELLQISLRYKKPDSEVSQLLTVAVKHVDPRLLKSAMSDNFLLASSVAEFGLLLSDSKYKGTASYLSAKAAAQKTLENDKAGYRKELVQLMEKALRLKKEGVVVIADE